MLTALVEDGMRVGAECKELIQLFSDKTEFGQSLLEQAVNVTIDEPDAKLSKS